MTIKFIGKKETHDSGATREDKTDRPMPGLIHPLLKAYLGQHLMEGAKNHAPWNWAKGLKLSGCVESMERHLLAIEMGLEDEDHISALIFNAMAFRITKDMIKVGTAPESLDDLPDFTALQPLFLEIMEGPKKEVQFGPSLVESTFESIQLLHRIAAQGV